VRDNITLDSVYHNIHELPVLIDVLLFPKLSLNCPLSWWLSTKV